MPYDNGNANGRLDGGAAPEASLSDQQLEAEAGGEGVDQEAGAVKKVGTACLQLFHRYTSMLYMLHIDVILLSAAFALSFKSATVH